ncbi:transmembrane protein 265-like isoform 2-T3 [Synchiropus picturatus]
MADWTHKNAAESLKSPISDSDYEGRSCLEKSPEPRSCCGADPHHRRLAIGSIICGCSYCGSIALTNSVKAEGAHDPAERERFRQRAKKCAWIAIAVFYGLLLLIPLLTLLISYCITLRE